MSGQAPIFEFNVSVINQTTKPVYVITTKDGSPSSGSVSVTAPNTTIVYTLNQDSAHLQFVGPEISNDVGDNISFSITNDGNSLILVDSDATIENICIKLVTAPKGQVYTSADPEVINKNKT